MLACGVLTIAVINLIRFIQTINQWEFLSELLPIPPLYVAVSGLTWGLIGSPLAWGLWRGRRWAPTLTRLAALAYTLYFWSNRLWLSTNDSRTNWPFAAATNIVLFSIVLWVLSRRKAKTHGEMYDR